MKLIKRINEGESYLNAFIGYKVMKYRNMDDSEASSLRVSINLYFILVKMEFITIKHDKETSN
jgi:hypothetical protein